MYWDYELKNVYEYIGYSSVYNDYISDLKKDKIKISSINSNYYSSLFYNKDNNLISKSKILLIGQSYIGEARQFYNSKLMDHNSYALENLIIKALIGLGENPIYKVHPKGFLKKNFLASKFKIQFNELALKDALISSEFVVVTSISTATIEALFSRKVIILIQGLEKSQSIFVIWNL